MDTLWLKDAGCLCRLGCREGGSKLISPVELEFRLQAFSLRGNELADFRSLSELTERDRLSEVSPTFRFSRQDHLVEIRHG